MQPAGHATIDAPDPLSAERTAEMLLWYFQETVRYRAEGRRRDAPLLDSEVILKLALGRRGHFGNPTLNEPGAAARLQQAASAYVRFLFFRPEATPYQTLGLAPGASPEAIKESFRLLMQLVHPDRQDARALWPDSFAAQANRAYSVLRNQDSRAKFDREAQARSTLARAMHRAAAESAASKMPVVQRPGPRLGAGGFLGRMTLPEWVTAGIGGYARQHPATIAFAVLIGVAALMVGLMVWERQEGWLTWDQPETLGPSVARIFDPARASNHAVVPDAGRSDTPAALRGGARSKPSAASAPTLSNPVAVAVAREGAPAAADRGPDPAPLAAKVELPPVATPTLAPVTVANAEALRTPAPSPPLDNVALVVRATPAEPVVPTPPSARTAPDPAPEPPIRADQVAAVSPPATAEVEALFATFVETYERGRADAFAALFDDDADANLRHGRAAIRGEYDELFRTSKWRRMQLTRVNWRRVGDRTVAKGEITVKIGWHDGREVEQHLALDMEIMRRDGRVVIARLTQQPKN